MVFGAKAIYPELFFAEDPLEISLFFQVSTFLCFAIHLKNFQNQFFKGVRCQSSLMGQYNIKNLNLLHIVLFDIYRHVLVLPDLSTYVPYGRYFDLIWQKHPLQFAPGNYFWISRSFTVRAVCCLQLRQPSH